MTEHDPEAYGRAWASEYDGLFSDREDPATVVAKIQRLTAGRRLLELGVGSGRLALPFADAGFTVTGVDASREMLDLLAARDPARRVTPVQGDMRTTALGTCFDVVLIGFSTLFLLGDQASQLAAVENAARHLEPDGRLVIEAFVADHARWQSGQRVALSRMTSDSVELEVARHRRDTQVIEVTYLIAGSAGVRLRPLRLRYAWPSEIDLMARVAGLHLVERVADWDDQPFGPSSGSHVSVYAPGVASG